MRVFTASNIEEIASIVNVVHDQNLCVDSFRYDEDKCLLQFRVFHVSLDERVTIKRMFPFKKSRFSVYQSFLRFHDVEEVSIDDLQKIGRYYINVIEYNKDEKKIVITAEPDLRVRLKVKRLRITYEITDELAGFRDTWFGRWSA